MLRGPQRRLPLTVTTIPQQAPQVAVESKPAVAQTAATCQIVLNRAAMPAPHPRDGINELAMSTAAVTRRMPPLTLFTEVRMIKGVGPQRAELLAKRGLHTLGDLLTYLPFRYEDRIHFSNVKDFQPNGIYTIRAKVMSGQAVRGMRRSDAIYHLLVQDAAGGLLPCKFFHGGYLDGRLKPGQWLVLHGKANVDKLRPARIEMVNPQMEMLGADENDSTEVGRIVPMYEAIGAFGSRSIRRAIYTVLQTVELKVPEILPAALQKRLGFPSRAQSIAHTHFPPQGESVDALNAYASPAQRRLIFEEFFLYQLSLALDRRAARKETRSRSSC